MVVRGPAPQERFRPGTGKLNPIHVIVAGLIAVALFIGILVTIVKIVVSQQ